MKKTIYLIYKNEKSVPERILTENTFHLFNTLEELSGFIKGIKPHDMARKTFVILGCKKITTFLEKNYKQDFFELNKELGGYELKMLKNGVRRTLAYTKRINNDSTLTKALKRIQGDLTTFLGGIDYAFEILPLVPSQERYKEIKIKLEDLRKENQENGFCIISFDQEKWEYKLHSIEAPRLKEVYEIINKVFEKNTASTRIFRAKKNENNSK
jgi:hypothetical protein